MKYRILILSFFIFCSVVQSKHILLSQKFLEVKNEEVKFLFDTWKYHFGLKTFGGGYVRHILLLLYDDSIVELELPEVSLTPGYSSSGFVNVDELSDIFLNLLFYPIEEILPDPYEKMRQEIKDKLNLVKEEPTVENFVNIISDLYSKKGKEIKVKNVYFRNSIKDLKLESRGNKIHLKFTTENKKQKYISSYKDIKEKNEILVSLSKAFGVEEKIKKEVVNIEVSDFTKEAWYVEILGNSFIGSLNVDYRFHSNFSLRLGASYIIFGFGFPVMLNFLTWGKSVHHLELGAGIVVVAGGFGETKFGSFETLTVGYRYQPKKNGLVFRISFTPLFNFPDKGEVIPWAGVSIGYAK